MGLKYATIRCQNYNNIYIYILLMKHTQSHIKNVLAILALESHFIFKGSILKIL